MAKLYRCTVEVELVVLAETHQEAATKAEDVVSVDDMGATPITGSVERIDELLQLPEGWDDSLPYGTDPKNERTCRQILEASRAGEGEG